MFQFSFSFLSDERVFPFATPPPSFLSSPRRGAFESFHDDVRVPLQEIVSGGKGIYKREGKGARGWQRARKTNAHSVESIVLDNNGLPLPTAIVHHSTPSMNQLPYLIGLRLCVGPFLRSLCQIHFSFDDKKPRENRVSLFYFSQMRRV